MQEFGASHLARMEKISYQEVRMAIYCFGIWSLVKWQLFVKAVLKFIL